MSATVQDGGGGGGGEEEERRSSPRDVSSVLYPLHSKKRFKPFLEVTHLTIV